MGDKKKFRCNNRFQRHLLLALCSGRIINTSDNQLVLKIRCITGNCFSVYTTNTTSISNAYESKWSGISIFSCWNLLPAWLGYEPLICSQFDFLTGISVSPKSWAELVKKCKQFQLTPNRKLSYGEYHKVTIPYRD